MAMLVNYDPFRNVRMLQNEINRLFDRDFDDANSMMSQWPLRVDIREEADHLLLLADLPGVEQKDIKLHVENNQLTISGERKMEDEKKRDSFHRIERMYGNFSRTFQLGNNTNPEKIQATFKNGVLEIVLPKREEAKPRSIEIQVQ
ncbi:Hsp20/alpha crystallin family protein [Candidatus Magnetaquicoccus inordinatus]|uniref:Hsp20/alpha crystallin family protein n=1 Tax=Candidatus Magnetaquicoccus inordinatus TaxID=2496818 RepID=UPI00102CA931|nr:Hsp20/alpha crystallin family protein [Candidatus Magnetaquicoccus inordinatus]